MPDRRNIIPGRGFNPAPGARLNPGMNQRTRQEIERLGNQIDNIPPAPAAYVHPPETWFAWTDFLHGDTGIYQPTVGVNYQAIPSAHPWVGVGYDSGGSPNQIAAQTGTAIHPGIIRLTGGSNKYARFMTHASAYLLQGGEKTRFIFRRPASSATCYCNLGYHDCTSYTGVARSLATDAVAFNITNLDLCGYAASNATRSETSLYTLTANTFYIAGLEVSLALDSVYFWLMDETGSELLWNETLSSSNIPQTTGRELGHGVICVVAGTLDMDYMDMELPIIRRAA